MKANKKFHSKRSTKNAMQQYCKSIAIHIYLPSYCQLYIQPKIIISHSVNSDFKLVVLIYNKSVQYVKKKNQNVKHKECR